MRAFNNIQKHELLFLEGLTQEDHNALVHFLHIGKCAGTTIKALIQSINQDRQIPLILAHPHRIGLADLPIGSRYFFSIRNPVTRFYSGFYGRKREDQPRLYVPWSETEQKAFERFPEANDLAEALFSDSLIGQHAFSAMQSIGHVWKHQHTWFPDIEDVFERRPPLCILRQEHLSEDIRFLKKALALPFDLRIETDRVKAHKNDYSAAPTLSERAVENLKMWYVADIQFYALANSWIERNQK